MLFTCQFRDPTGIKTTSGGSSECNTLMSRYSRHKGSFDQPESYLNTVLLSSRAEEVVVFSLSVSSVMTRVGL